jgi:hypothetical protein
MLGAHMARSRGSVKRETVGDPSNPNSLGREVAEAYASGAREIDVRKGVYLFDRANRSIFNLDQWHDATVNGNGATLISSETQWGNEIFHMNHCDNVEVKNFVFSQTWQTALQGRVISVDRRPAHTTHCIWRPDPGYPVPDESAKSFNKGPNIVDGTTRLLRHGSGDDWDAPISSLHDGTFEVIFHNKSKVEVGDWLVSRGAVAPCKVHLEGCRGCTIENVICLRNAFAGILEWEGGGNHYIHCQWDVGPTPPGAVDSPLVSCSVDGFHSNLASPGPDLENCQFNGVLLDDCIAIHGDLQEVVGSNGNTIVVNKDGGKLGKGQPIRIGAKGFFADAMIIGRTIHNDHTVTFTLDRSLNVPVGAMVGNPLKNGQGFKVIGCHVGNTRSRGMLVKGDGGLIENNTIEGCGMSGVSAGPDYPLEGDFVEGLTIRGNTFLGNGFVGQDLAAIQLHGGLSMGNSNVVIEDNEFRSNYSGDIDIHWTRGAVVSRNRFFGPSVVPSPLRNPASVLVWDSADVSVSGNTFSNLSNYRTPMLWASPEVQGFRHSANVSH